MDEVWFVTLFPSPSIAYSLSISATNSPTDICIRNKNCVSELTTNDDDSDESTQQFVVTEKYINLCKVINGI